MEGALSPNKPVTLTRERGKGFWFLVSRSGSERRGARQGASEGFIGNLACG